MAGNAKDLVDQFEKDTADKRKSRLSAQADSTKIKIAELKKYGQLELAKKIAEWQKTRQALMQQIVGSGGSKNPRNAGALDQLEDILSNLDEADATIARLSGTEVTGDTGKNKPPRGVPADAKFDTKTGNWTLGDQTWDKNGQAVVEVKTSDKKTSTSTGGGKVVTGTMPEVPTGAPADATIPAGFDPGRFRMGEEASMGATKPVIPTGKTETPFEKIMAEAVKLYGGIDEIFNTDEELKNLLVRAIGDVTTARDDMDEAQFVNLLQNTTWFKSNAGPIRQRGFERRQYETLIKKIKENDPQYQAKIDELNRTSAYGRGLQDVIELLRENATKLGRQVSDEELRIAAQGIYDYANENDAVKIRNAVLGIGSFGTGKGLVTGAAGQNLTTLRSVARANGLDLDVMFKDSIDTWLDRISKGESIETFKSIIRNTAKSGLPDRVAGLLDQGVDLETIYNPYKRLMASVLEINPETIRLDDPTLRMGIGPDKELSLYDYQRMLRKDARWQYTNNARQEVASTTLGILRDFGFQG